MYVGRSPNDASLAAGGADLVLIAAPAKSPRPLPLLPGLP